MQGERGKQRRQALAAAAKDAKLSQLRRNMQALEAKLIRAMQTDAHRSFFFRTTQLMLCKLILICFHVICLWDVSQ